MTTIWRYRLRLPALGKEDRPQTVALPLGARVVHVAGEGHGGTWWLCIWVSVDSEMEADPREFLVLRTGRAIPEDWCYLGTAQTHGTQQAWHVFEEER